LPREFKGFYLVLLPYGLLLLGVIYGLVRLLIPLMGPMLVALFFAVFIHPLYGRSARLRPLRSHPNLTAGLWVLALLAFIIAPAVYGAFALVREAPSLYQSMTKLMVQLRPYLSLDITEHLPTFLSELIRSQMGSAWGVRPIEISLGDFLREVGQGLLSYLTGYARGLLANTLKLTFDLFLVLVFLFYFLRDGGTLLRVAVELMPLSSAEKGEMLQRMDAMMRGILYGTLLTALVQALLAGMGFAVAGIPFSWFLAILVFFASMLPMLGTYVVWLPVVLALVFLGEHTRALGLLLWGLLVVSGVDNVLKPVLIAGGGKVHGLAVFVGIFGGLSVFGFLGIFVGPLLVGFSLFLIETYYRRVRGLSQGLGGGGA